MQDLRDVMPLADAAGRLAMPAAKLRGRIRAGELAARRQAGRWMVPVSEVRRLEGLPRPEGRPYSPEAAWAMLTMLSGHPVALAPPRRSQLRRHLRERGIDELAGRLRRRASRRPGFVHPSKLDALASDPRTVVTGWAGAEQVGAPLRSTQSEPTEVYVHQPDLEALLVDYAVADAVEVANVVLQVVADRLVIPQQQGTATAPVVGLDLLESGDPRGRQAGHGMFADAVAAFRER
ncbi:hypothetical protein [Egibacter rhizosphaerae]|uniref:hypothetical protein n=1 Tax=Egibacter rhizosphaerae TaxID=1670831 RepID=UPI0013F15918|nr:hypothetical protein [Egibacter rhizosphaerae]